MPTPTKIKRFGVLGSGEVGQTLAKGLKTHGYQVRIGTRTPAKLADFTRSTGIEAGSFADVARWGEALVLAVLGEAAMEVLTTIGAASLGGKPILDTTNALSHEPPEQGVLKTFTGPNESLLERMQQAYPQAHFVKAFNSVGSALMVNPKIPSGRPTMFYCGNDAGAKALAASVIEQFGWEGADMGGAIAARAIEPLAVLWCIPGFLQNDWTHAFRVVRP